MDRIALRGRALQRVSSVVAQIRLVFNAIQSNISTSPYIMLPTYSFNKTSVTHADLTNISKKQCN